ncbi:mitogen-activated protein kinase kinase kinase 9, variant 2 [Balamuthia mandrillaris]
MTYGRNNTRLYVVLAMPEYFFNLGAPTGRVLEFDVATGELLAYSAPLLSPFDVKIGPNGNLFVTEMFLSSRYSSILELTASSFSQPPSTLCNSTIQRPMEPLYAAWGPCPPTTIIREPEGSSGDGDEVTSAERLLSIVLPVMFSLLLVGAAFFLGFWANGCWKRRRREYEVKDRTDDGDDYEIGRTGKSRFTFAMIDPEELRVGQLLGCGAFGKVYKGMWRGAEVAIKMFNDFDLDSADEKTILEIKEEAQMMERLSKHPNVVKFIGVVMQKQYHHHNEDLKNDLNNNVDLSFALILEYCPFGSLYDVVVKRKQRLPLVTLLRVARDIAAGILHLHKENVIHRDIAARNVLVGENFSVYISDFGMARAKQTDINVTSSNLGPVKWMAPEAMLKRQYSEASDAFSFGVLLWELVTCNVPWRGLAGSQVILAVAKNNTRLKIPGDCDPILKKIIKSVWEDRPEKRMTFTEIVRRLSAHHDALAHLYGEDQAAAEDDALSYLCASPRRTSDDTVSASNSSDDDGSNEEEDLTATITPTHSTNTPTTETPSSSSPLNELRLSDSYAIMVNSSIPQFSQDFVGDPSSISSSSADEAAAIMTTKKHNDKKHNSKRRKEMLSSSLAISGQPNMDDIISYRL